MTYQTGANVFAAIRQESTMGVAATVTGANQLRILSSPGLDLKRAIVQSKEKRTDMTETMGRLGARSVTGSYNAELTVGGATDVLLAAIMRTSWVTSTAIAFSAVTTVAIGTNYLSSPGGVSWASQGVRIGDVFTLSGTTVPGDNGFNTRVVSLTTATIGVAPATFTTLGATATGTLTILNKLSTPAAPTRVSFTVEEKWADLGLSEVFLGCRVIGVKISCKPGAMAQVSYTLLGLDRNSGLGSPYFTSPAVTTGLGLLADDSTIRYNGAVVATFSGLEIDFSITAKGEPVIGSLVAPDIFDNDLSVSGQITGLMSDFSNLTLYDAETEFDLSVLFQEESGAPKNCLGFYLPRIKLSELTAPVGGDGATIETKKFIAGALVGTSVADAAIATIHSSVI